jgi:hypothetical protein
MGVSKSGRNVGVGHSHGELGVLNTYIQTILIPAMKLDVQNKTNTSKDNKDNEEGTKDDEGTKDEEGGELSYSEEEDDDEEDESDKEDEKFVAGAKNGDDEESEREEEDGGGVGPHAGGFYFTRSCDNF